MNRKKLVIIVACIIIIGVIIGVSIAIATPSEPTPPAQDYTLTTHISPPGAGSVSPSGGEYESGVQVTLTASPASNYTFDYWISALGKTYTPTITITMDSDKSFTANFETIVPTQFTTYTDEASLFSISYPSDWELALEQIEELERLRNDVLDSIAWDIPLEEVSTLFLAGLPAETDLSPNVNIVVEPLLEGWTLDEAVAAGLRGLKEIEVMSNYHELSRVKTTVDNRTAVILEFQLDYEGAGTFHFVMMCCVVDNTFWTVGCMTLPDEFGKWEDVFDDIVRSLRVLK